MLEKVKLALRITSNAFDDDLKDQIEACKADLRIAGIDGAGKTDIQAGDGTTAVQDALIRRAIILYAQWHQNFEGNADRYQRAYESLKCQLALAGAYHAEL